jgi:hypothetical protein
MHLLRVACALSLVPAAVAQNPLQVASPNGQIVSASSGQTALHSSVSFRGKPFLDETGKSVWDWSSGETATRVSFTLGRNTETLKHYIEFAAESGSLYRLIDAGADTTQIASCKPPIERNPVLDVPIVSRGGNAIWIHPEKP